MSQPARGRENAELFEAILEHSVDAVGVISPTGEVLYDSQAIQNLVGYRPAERIGKSVFDLIHPDDEADQREFLEEVLAAGPEESFSAVVRLRHRDGSWRVIQARSRNLIDDPRVGGILINLRDVTEHQEAREELEATQELLQEVVESAPLVLWKVDVDGVFQFSEGRGLEDMGLEPGELVGRSAYDVYRGSRDVAHLERALAGETVEARVRVGDRVYESRIEPIREGGEVVGAVGLSLDVTDAEREAAQVRFQAELLNQVGQAVIATDPQGTVIYWNRTAEELYGYSREEALGRSIGEVTVPEAAHASAAEIMAELQAGRPWSGEYEVRRKDGSTFPALVANQPVMEDGELVAIIGISSDQTERRGLEAQLQQAQKMEAIGQLAGGIAHEFNNLLTSIGGYASLAAEASSDPQVQGDLEQIREATARARGLADKLLAFSRRRVARLEPVDLTGVVTEMVAMINRVLGADVKLRLDLTPPGSMWFCRADPGLMEQVIVNLVMNARQAMPHGGTVTLKTDRVTLDRDRAAALGADLSPGEYVRLRVEDTGEGIEPEAMPRIFEPFFTTKEVGEGSGLGLSMVYGAVKQSGGGVTVQSEPGEGTEVSIYLPRVEPEAARDAKNRPPTGPPGSARVLLVEDEEAVRTLVRRVLDREGYELIEARTGREALEKLLGRDDLVDLVVTDVIMPEMGGPELVQRLRQERSDLRALFISGYTASELESRGLDRGAEHFLAKPFAPRELVMAVRKALAD